MRMTQPHSTIVTARSESKPDLLSIVCPAYNEAEGVQEFIDRVRSTMADMAQEYELVMVNDGSTDATILALRALQETMPELAVLDLSRNFGKEIALSAGLDHVRGDAVVVIDCDLQDPPELIADMVSKWRKGYDVVYARRRARHGETWLKKTTANLFYQLMQKLGPAPIPRNTGDFRLMSRKVVDAVCALREKHRMMKGVFAWVGFPATEILYDRDPRHAGQSKWNYWKLWNLGLEGITSNTLAPLKISTYLGLLTAAFAFCLGVFYVGKTLLFGDPVAGFPTLAAIVLFLGGMQLTVLGVVGEYLGRIFNETKNRPLYFVNEWKPTANSRDVDWEEVGKELRKPRRSSAA